VHAKDPFSPRIEGNIAFPDAEVANSDGGLFYDESQFAAQRVAALIADTEALLILATVDQLMLRTHKVKAERRSCVNFTQLRTGTDQVRRPQRLHPARSSQ
jgi:hypothetical protein